MPLTLPWSSAVPDSAHGETQKMPVTWSATIPPWNYISKPSFPGPRGTIILDTGHISSLPLLPTSEHTTNHTKRKRKSYFCYLLFWCGSRNIQDRHTALILKYRGISRHTEGCAVIIQIRRLWHKSDNLASTYEREKYTELPLKMFTAEKGHAELSDLKRKHSLAQVYVDRFWEPYKCCSF